MYILFNKNDKQISGYYDDDLQSEMEKINAKYAKKITGQDDGGEILSADEKIINENYNDSLFVAEENKDAIEAIDTGIAQGMTAGYDYKGKIISTSLAAQCNWNNVINRLNKGEPVDFPYPISLVNGGVVMIADEAEMYLLYNSASKTLETLHNAAIIARSELI